MLHLIVQLTFHKWIKLHPEISYVSCYWKTISETQSSYKSSTYQM